MTRIGRSFTPSQCGPPSNEGMHSLIARDPLVVASAVTAAWLLVAAPAALVLGRAVRIAEQRANRIRGGA